MYDILPHKLKQDEKFCLWRYEKRGDKPTKVPYQVTAVKSGATIKNALLILIQP